jgi:heme-degrading monooxygenase HmoA
MTFRGAKNIDDGLAFLQEKAMPVVSTQTGYRGLTASADRDGGVFGILSLWETEADCVASQTALNDLRQDALGIIGGELDIANYEQVIAEIGEVPPGPGAALLIQRVSMDPARVEDNLAFFKKEVVPQIKANTGFLGLRNLVDRRAGQSIVGTAWTDSAALQSALAAGEQRRQEAAGRGVTFVEASEREILFSDFR